MFTKAANFKGKVRLVALGKNSIVYVTEDNEIYRCGYGKDGALGNSGDISNFTKL